MSAQEVSVLKEPEATREKGRRRQLVIGVGNPYRCDDGVGIAIARRIRSRNGSFEVVEASGEGAALMELWRADDHVVLVDAVRAGDAPGRIHRFDAGSARVPADFFRYSTHAFSVAEAVEVSRVLGSLPERLVIYGVEGKTFGCGIELSVEVEAVVGEVTNRILMEFDVVVGDHTHTLGGESRCTSSL